jgi:hypothetical protein
VLAWIAAMLGAEVHLLDSSDEHSTLRKLGRDLHVKVNWSSLNEPLLPAHAIIRVGAPPHDLSVEPGGLYAIAEGPSTARRTMISRA